MVWVADRLEALLGVAAWCIWHENESPGSAEARGVEPAPVDMPVDTRDLGVVRSKRWKQTKQCLRIPITVPPALTKSIV
ncbi:hypothetical protein AB1N83_011690 [Pleurotus pulmonarius]